MVGDRYGALEVVKEYYQSGYKICICDCDCGETIAITEKSLKNFKKRSCGCASKNKAGTLCWTCVNAVPRRERVGKRGYGEYITGCNWSINLKPVEGWKAEPTMLRNACTNEHNVPSFNVIECPMYVKKKRKKIRLIEEKKIS